MDYKIELVAIPVSDVDRAKAFYVDQVGFNADHDHVVTRTALRPAHAARLGLLDLHRQGLTDAGPARSAECRWSSPTRRRPTTSSPSAASRSPTSLQPWGEFVHFKDPDGNAWALQAIPGRQ